MYDGDGAPGHGPDDEPASASRIRDGWPTFDLRYVVEARDGRADRCTIYPADAGDCEAATQWLAADEGGFLSVEEIR